MTMKGQEKKSKKDAKEKNQTVNLHPSVDVVAIVLGTLATLSCIIGYIYSLDSSTHNIVSLWLYCLAALFTAGVLCRAAKALIPLFILGGLICIAVCFHLQEKWLALDASNKPIPKALPESNDTVEAFSDVELPGPRQITDKISSADPYQQDAIAKSFANTPVDWKLYLDSIKRSSLADEKDVLHIGLDNTPNFGPNARLIYLRVPILGNERLSLLKKGSLVRVRGFIQSADTLTIDLKDGATIETVDTK